MKSVTVSSKWKKWITEPGHIRVVAIEASALLNELCVQHKLTGPVQLGYADAIVGSLLIASAHKSNESINMNAQGSGLYRQAVIDASPEGRVRGFLIEQKDSSALFYGQDGKNGPWGSGVLSILYTKNLEGKAPYKGMVAISTGFLDDAINDYYRDSEQLASKVGLAVEYANGEIKKAAGVLVQALGGATPEEIEFIHSLSTERLRETAQQISAPLALDPLLLDLFANKKLKSIDLQNLSTFCTCSQERVERAMLLTGKEDSLEALGLEDFLEISCDFCCKQYRISSERLKALFSLDPRSLH